MARSTHLQMQERYDAILRFASEQKPVTVPWDLLPLMRTGTHTENGCGLSKGGCGL